MNRPFYAFGALLAALALAIVAVSSTNRSTSVARGPADRSASTAAGPTSQKLRQRASFSGLIVVLPAARDVDRIGAVSPVAAECLAYASASYESSPVDVAWHDDGDECGWDCREVCPLLAARTQPLSVAVVQLATHDPALLRDETSRDCRSHYDAAYDVMVYGDVDSPPASFGPTAAAERSSAPVEWNDYAVLIDEALAARTAAAASAESTNSVLSGRQLLDFAAMALKNAGILLQSAGEQLKSAAVLESTDQIAGDQETSTR